MIEDFRLPPAKYRIRPFWFWNGVIDKETIYFQLKEMKKKGLGGVFICPRQGQTTAYLSKKWFGLVEYACAKAAEIGLEAWLYDEYPYPSGMSGGEVLLQHPEAEHKVLNHYCYEENGPVEKQYILPFGKVLCARAFRKNTDGLLDYQNPVDLGDCAGNLQTTELYQISGLTAYNQKRFFTADPQRVFEVALPEGNWAIHFYIEGKLGEFKYYGAFFDPCDTAAVKTFLETTHERYKKHVGGQFGGAIKGLFSDEVGLLSPIPWSGRLPEYFEQENGYSILDSLPALHDTAYPDCWRIRFDLYNTLHRLLVNTYHRQTAAWCARHNLYYATEVPSMRLTTQRHSTIVGGDPGHEKLGKPLEWIYDTTLYHYRSNPLAISSLQRQLGRDFAMTESFHSVGWTMTLQDAKWMLDRLAASGINLYNVHAFYYSIASINKHDAPPSQFLQNPYWKHYGLLADYAARLSAMVTNTQPCVEIAVLDPVASLWTSITQPFSGFTYTGEDEKERALCDRLREDWVFICKTLLFNQLAYEHLDAELLAEASVEEGRLCLGRACYSTLIIPPSLCLESRATEVLTRFAEGGGKVLALGVLPHRVIDGGLPPEAIYTSLFGVEDTFAASYIENAALPDDQRNRLLERGESLAFYPTKGGVSQAPAEPWLAWCKAKRETGIAVEAEIAAGKNLVSSVRKGAEESWYVFLANQGKETICTRILLNTPSQDGIYRVEEHSLETGSSRFLSDESSSFTVQLLPFQSRLLCLRPAAGEPAKTQADCPRIVLPLEGEKLPVNIEGGNIYRLADFEMSFDKARWAPAEPKTFIEQCAGNPLLDHTHFSFASAFGLPRKVAMQYPLTVHYRQRFTVQHIPDALCLLLDKQAISGKHEIALNGAVIPENAWQSRFVNDQNNMLADVQPLVRLGENTLEITVLVEKDADGVRDPLYLYGDFGVSLGAGQNPPVIIAKPQESVYGHGFVEGFPFYSGTFTFESAFTIDEEQLATYKHNAVVEFTFDMGTELYQDFALLINGQSAGVRVFAPYIWQLPSGALQEGKNTVEIIVKNTLANMLDGAYFDYEKHSLVSIC